MRIHATDKWFSVDLDSEASSWLVVVIDDSWQQARALVADVPADSRDEKLAEAWYRRTQELGAGDEGDIQSLGLAVLPVLIARFPEVATIAYCNFPSSSGELTELLAEIGHESGRWFTPSHVVALLDIRDASTSYSRPEDRLGDMLQIMDEVGQPAFARVRFTYGRRSEAAGAENLELLDKGGLIADFAHARDQTERALVPILATHTYQNFRDATGTGPLHEPHRIHETSQPDRIRVCRTLETKSRLGIWRWVRELAALDEVRAATKSRWFAAKAFEGACDIHNLLGGSVAGLVAVCEGASVLLRPFDHAIEVLSDLYAVQPGPQGFSDYALGKLELTGGDLYRFCQRLSAWLRARANYELRASRLSQVAFARTRDYLKLTFTFCGPLPAYFEPEYVPRRGSPGASHECWNALVTCARSSPICGATAVELPLRLLP